MQAKDVAKIQVLFMGRGMCGTESLQPPNQPCCEKASRDLFRPIKPRVQEGVTMLGICLAIPERGISSISASEAPPEEAN